MSTRCSIAKALYMEAARAYPGRPLLPWEELPAKSLEYWGRLADTALAVVELELATEEARAVFTAAWADADHRDLPGSRVFYGLRAVARFFTGRHASPVGQRS
jgi:hypothetical protein